MSAKELLLSMNACPESIGFADGKTIKQAWEGCHRGDWMLWFYRKKFPNDIRKLTLAKAYCANTVRGLMHDERSRYAIDVAIKFGYGFATPGKLKESAKAAAASASAASASAASAYATAASASAASASAASAYAAYAAYASAYDPAAYAYDPAAYAYDPAADAAAASAYAAYDPAAYDPAAYAAAKKQNQLLTADICRQLFDISSLYEIGE